MSFNLVAFTGEGSLRGRANKAEFNYDVGSDLLTEVLADDFFLSQQGLLPVGSIINLRSPAGDYVADVTVSDSANLNISLFTGVQSITGAGAIDIVNRYTLITTTGADAFTLIDGALGQLKTMIVVVDGGSAVITPSNLFGPNAITMDAEGDSVTLQFFTGGWVIVGNNASTTA